MTQATKFKKHLTEQIDALERNLQQSRERFRDELVGLTERMERNQQSYETLAKLDEDMRSDQEKLRKATADLRELGMTSFFTPSKPD